MPPAVPAFLKKALLGSAFCFWALIDVPGWAQDASCRSDHFDQVGEVRTVIDGDTVLLTDGRLVRLIGINTPERRREQRPAEPLAEQARSALATLLERQNYRIALRFDDEREDRYGRLLAHPFSQQGDNLTADLLRGGWGMAIAVPPNLRFQACYRSAEENAREQARGVWSEAYFEPYDASALTPSTLGFRRVRGRLERIGFSRDALWLQVGRLGVRIDKKHLGHFRRWNFHSLQGRELEVRGWVSAKDEQLRMNLKHPNDFALMDSQ